MKKKILILLCLTLTFTLAACGSTKENNDSSVSSSTVEAVELETTSGVEITMRSDDDAACDVLPIVMVKGKLYSATGEISTLIGRCGNLDGEIKSTVYENQIPTENDQSNFGSGYGYQFAPYDDGVAVEVYIDDQWWVFKAMEDKTSVEARNPYADIKVEDIQSVTVEVFPPGTTAPVTDLDEGVPVTSEEQGGV